MQRKIVGRSSLVFAVLLLVFIYADSKNALCQDLFQERSVIGDLNRLHGAQMTYNAIAGDGNDFGALNQLLEYHLIDSVLASGDKYGYWFLLSVTRGGPQKLPKFSIIATPQKYGQTGRRSFFIDESGEIHGADKNGRLAGPDDPLIDGCVVSGISDNERCAVQVLRSLHGAEMTYGSTSGNGSYGSLKQLVATGLIWKSLSNGLRHGYSFSVITSGGGSNLPTDLRISASPQKYGITGIKSYFIGADGIVRGADKKGKVATEKDSPFDICASILIPEIEQCIYGSLRNLYYAQMSYAQAAANGNYGSLAELRDAKLLDQGLEASLTHGYLISVVIISPTISAPARFTITAVPQIYGKTGFKSFYIDETGVLRGIEKNGKPAEENDPPINE